MEKNQFKGSSTLRLARTFLSKNKVMETWKGQQTLKDKDKDAKIKLSRHDQIKESPEYNYEAASGSQPLKSKTTSGLHSVKSKSQTPHNETSRHI